MDNIRIFGTHHLMSKEDIYDLLDKEKPEVIGVELCETRYKLMVTPTLDGFKIENPKEDDSLLGKISNVIKKKAEKENFQYGSDQINACIYASEKNIPLEFVDLDIMKTKELMEKLPKEEQEGFMKEMLEFQNRSIEETIKNIDVEKYLIELKTKYPIAFEFLINLRNIFILNKILKLKIKYPDKKIVIVLGKGHEKIIEDGLKI